MQTLSYFQISSTRCCGIWGEERFNIGDGYDPELAHGFCSFAAAMAFIQNEVDKLKKQPGFFRDVFLETIVAGKPYSEFKLTYEAFDSSKKVWRPIVLKFRIQEKTLKLLDAAETTKAIFH